MKPLDEDLEQTLKKNSNSIMAERGGQSRLKLNGHRGIWYAATAPAAFCWRYCDSQKAIRPARPSVAPRADEAESRYETRSDTAFSLFGLCENT